MWKYEAENPKATVVIIHGAAEHHGRYKWLVEMFRSEGFHVVMGDLPGQGTTSRRERGHISSFDDYIHEVENWINVALEYQLPTFLLGHSMGGLITIRALQEKTFKIKAAILSSPCLGLVQYPPKFLDLLSQGLNMIFPTIRLESHLSVEKATRNKEVRDFDENDTLYVTKVSVRWYRELIKSMKLAHKNISKVPDLPILTMQGGDDKIVNKVDVKEWFDQLATTEKAYKEWNHLYHEIFNEPEREDVFKYTLKFIEQHL